MDKDKKSFPSIPSNFLTLAQLQERWLKEKQRKQREKEEEDERERLERKEEERRREEEENQKRQNENAKGSEAKALPTRLRRLGGDRRNRPENSSETIGLSEGMSNQSQVEVTVVNEEEKKIDDLKKKKNKKKKNSKKRGKPREEEALTGGTEELLPELEKPEEKTLVVSTEKEGKKEEVRNEFRQGKKEEVSNKFRQGKKKEVRDEFRRHGKLVREKKVPVDQSREIGRKFDDLSLNGGKGGNKRHSEKINGRQWMYNGGSGRFNLPRLVNRRDANLVWVKKEDNSHRTVSEFGAEVPHMAGRNPYR